MDRPSDWLHILVADIQRLTGTTVSESFRFSKCAADSRAPFWFDESLIGDFHSLCTMKVFFKANKDEDHVKFQ